MQPINLNSVVERRSIPGVRALDEEWTLVACGRVLYRRRVLLLSITGLGMLAALLASAIQTPMYRSHASIQIQGINDNFLNFRDIYPTTAPSADNAVYIQTQAEILRQDALLEKVINKVHLDQRSGFRNHFKVRDTTPAGIAPATLEEVRKNVQIVAAKGSSILQIVCSASEPQLAADLSNALAETFIEESIEARQRSAQQTQSALTLERDALWKKLAELEIQLDGYGGRDRGTTGYSALKRELDANRQFYQTISQRIDEARVASAMNQSNVRLVNAAGPAAYPYKPNLALNLIIGIVGSLLLAIGYIMFREQTSSVWRLPGEASASLALPEIGAIPKAEVRRCADFRFGPGAATVPVEHLSLDHSSSGISESFRAAATSIFSTGQNGDHPHLLVVTSARSGEGKTTVASNLAIALTEIGGRVLLIDGDLRRPRLHKVFNQPNSWGLSDLLREKNAVEDLPVETLVKRTNIPRLHLLPGGTPADNIFELFLSGRMARLLPRFRLAFDYVVIDAPPCLEFADARILGRCAELLILVIRADYTGRQTAQAAVQRLLLDGIHILGIVFNCWNPSDGDIYGYSFSRRGSA